MDLKSAKRVDEIVAPGEKSGFLTLLCIHYKPKINCFIMNLQYLSVNYKQ